MLPASAADLLAADVLFARDEVGLGEQLWLSSLFRGADMIVRRRDAGEWYMVLGDCCSVGVFGWPVMLRAHGVQETVALVEEQHTVESFLVITDLEAWVARPWCVDSPLRFASRVVVGGASCSPTEVRGLQIRVSGPEMSILRCLALGGFRGVSQTTLAKLGSHVGLQSLSGLNMAETLAAVSAHAVGGDNTMVLQCLQRRVASEATDDLAEHASKLELLDDVLDADDRDIVRTEQRERSRHRDLGEDLLQQVGQVRRQLLGLGNRKVSASHKNASSPLAGHRVNPTIPEGALTQAECKTLMPPRSFVWQGKSGNWQSHVPGHRRFSRAWTVGGHRAAALAAVRDAWRKFLCAHNMTEAQCPVTGLFAEGE